MINDLTTLVHIFSGAQQTYNIQEDKKIITTTCSSDTYNSNMNSNMLA